MSLIWFDWIEPNCGKLHVMFFFVNESFVDGLKMVESILQIRLSMSIWCAEFHRHMNQVMEGLIEMMVAVKNPQIVKQRHDQCLRSDSFVIWIRKNIQWCLFQIKNQFGKCIRSKFDNLRVPSYPRCCLYDVLRWTGVTVAKVDDAVETCDARSSVICRSVKGEPPEVIALMHHKMQLRWTKAKSWCAVSVQRWMQVVKQFGGLGCLELSPSCQSFWMPCMVCWQSVELCQSISLGTIWAVTVPPQDWFAPLAFHWWSTVVASCANFDSPQICQNGGVIKIFHVNIRNVDWDCCCMLSRMFPLFVAWFATVEIIRSDFWI